MPSKLESAASIPARIDAYHGKICGNEPWRYRSWEHCFRFFRQIRSGGTPTQRNEAALQLAFYLASWGMYRGSSFLLQYDYTVHLPAVETLLDTSFLSLWETDVGSADADADLVPLILDAIAAVKQPYKPLGEATDTLATKVLLGTLGCLPACDRFFIDGFTSAGNSYSYLNRNFVHRIIRFCLDNSAELQTEQVRIAGIGGLRYPLMKLADMYFWQIGFEAWDNRRGATLPQSEHE